MDGMSNIPARDVRMRGFQQRTEVDAVLRLIAERVAPRPSECVELAHAGANTLVAGTSIFHTPDPASAARQMRKLATEAISQRV